MLDHQLQNCSQILILHMRNIALSAIGLLKSL